MAGDSEEERDAFNHTPLRIPGLLYVSVKMENPNLTLSGDLLPHVSGSFPLGPSSDPSKAVIFTHPFHHFIPFILGLSYFFLLLLLFVQKFQLSMERESATVWELSFVVPPNHGNAFSPAWCLPFYFMLVVNLYV